MPLVALVDQALTQVSVGPPTSPRMLLCILGAVAFSAFFVRQERKA